MSLQTAEQPVLTDLLTRPQVFFRALAAQPPRPGRYLWLVLLTGLISGIYAYLSQRGVQEALSGLPGGLGGGTVALVTSLLVAPLSMLVMWLILRGLGGLGAGKEGRAGEVFGAGFLPSLIGALILLPLSAFLAPTVNLPAPDLSGLEGPALAKAVQAHTAAVQAQVSRQPFSIISNILSYAAMAWQFYLAYIGFGVLTGDRQKAMKGTLIPLGVFVLLGVAAWLLGRATQGLVGGA